MIPWTVRYAKAQLDIGRPVPNWLHMSVQMVYNAPACHHA